MRKAGIVPFLFFLPLTLQPPADAQSFWAANGSHIFNTNSGNVGIGTSAPSAKLDVVGDVEVTGGITLQDTSNTQRVTFIGNNQTNNYFYISPWDWNTFSWRDTVINAGGGSVGIGTASPDPNYALSVNGSIRAKEIVVETGWADFVFAPDYRLPSLAEVESYIDVNGHLPEIPSARKVEAEGVGLGEMQVKLLRKIEELTLYLIEQDRKIDRLEASNARLEATVAGLDAIAAGR